MSYLNEKTPPDLSDGAFLRTGLIIPLTYYGQGVMIRDGYNVTTSGGWLVELTTSWSVPVFSISCDTS